MAKLDGSMIFIALAYYLEKEWYILRRAIVVYRQAIGFGQLDRD